MKHLQFKIFIILSLFVFTSCKESNIWPTLMQELCEDMPNSKNMSCNYDGSFYKSDDNNTDGNTAPTADKKSITVNNSSSVEIVLTGNDKDDDNLTFRVVETPKFGTLSGTAPDLTYTPQSTYVGEDSFKYVANDGTEDSKEATVSIEVTKESTDSTDPKDPTDPKEPTSTVKISGKVTYDYIPAKSNHKGLDYSNISKKSVKEVFVVAVDSSGKTYASTYTSSTGNYELKLPKNTNIKIKVSAKMQKSKVASWDIEVVDNTKNDSLYVLEGTIKSTGSNNSIRNINASSGWGGSSYDSKREAAPFAILDTIYSSMKVVLSAKKTTSFPKLTLNWSTQNSTDSGTIKSGKIGTTYYKNNNIYVLGKEDKNTDEYDNHVIAHEWFHYYEDKFSRSDSIGGKHQTTNILDIRVAFSEGLANAFSAMALDDPIYFDTNGYNQASGSFFDIESGTNTNIGWFNEGSIHRVIYDIYDDKDDNRDKLSLGFTPIHKVMTGSQKSTELFTSIFSFITYLKKENTSNVIAIDNILEDEDIAEITDINGTGRTNKPSELPTYKKLIVGSTVNVCPKYDNGTFNKLGNRAYASLLVDTNNTYTIKVTETTSTSSTNPDIIILDLSSNLVAKSSKKINNIEILNIKLSKSNYLLDVYDANSTNNACFDVSVK